MRKKKTLLAFGTTLGATLLFVGGWYITATTPALRRVASQAALRATSLGSPKPKRLLRNQEATVRLKGILEKNPQTTISFYRLVGVGWSIGLDVSQYQGAPIKDAVGKIVTAEGTQKRLLFIRKLPDGGPDPTPRPPIEGDVVVVHRLTY